MIYYKKGYFIRDDVLGKLIFAPKSLVRLKLLSSILSGHKRLWWRFRNIRILMRLKRISYFGSLLRMQQKFKVFYTGIKSYQLAKIIKVSQVLDGIFFDNFVGLLESRLDLLCFRAKFFSSVLLARQSILHGRVFVNGKCIYWPNYMLNSGDKISVLLKSKKENQFTLGWLSQLFKKQFFKNWLTFFLDRHTSTFLLQHGQRINFFFKKMPSNLKPVRSKQISFKYRTCENVFKPILKKKNFMVYLLIGLKI